MKFSQSVKIGGWFLVSLNLLMALGAIWVFLRMAPAIRVIIDQNERSLQACENMLTVLAAGKADPERGESLQQLFTEALQRAENNITETDEPAALQAIRAHYDKALAGDEISAKKTIEAISALSEINRSAMIRADMKAQQFGSAGAWGIVFMAVAVFFTGMLVLRSQNRNLILPLEEIYSVIQARNNGDRLRRCSGAELPADIRRLYSEINDLLDRDRSR